MVGASRHGYTDKGRVERGSNVSSTSPSHHPYICPRSSTVATHSGQWHGGSFSPWIYGQGKGRKRVERELYFTQPQSIYLSYILHSRQPLWAMAWWESSRHGYMDKGRVERGPNVSSTSPSHHPYISPISSLVDL